MGYERRRERGFCLVNWEDWCCYPLKREDGMFAFETSKLSWQLVYTTKMIKIGTMSRQMTLAFVGMDGIVFGEEVRHN